MERTAFVLNVQNRTQQSQRVTLFDSLFSSDPSGTYTWDLTDELAKAITNGLSQLALLATSANSDQFQLYNYSTPGNVPFATIAEVIAGLNSFGIGVFTNLSGNIVSVTSTEISFQSLNLTATVPALHNTTDGTNFTTGGSLIYDEGYSESLVGGFTQISTSNSFWTNSLGQFKGPYNRSNAYAVKAAPIDMNLFGNILSNASKKVYLGLAFSYNSGLGNNSGFVEIRINGVRKILVSDNTALTQIADNINNKLSTSYLPNEVGYIVWHILPIELNAGENLLQAIMLPSGTLEFIGIEVYDNTAAEIASSTSYTTLDILFSSINYIGKLFF